MVSSSKMMAWVGQARAAAQIFSGVSPSGFCTWAFPLGTAASVLLLTLSAWLLVRANSPEPSQPTRTYIFAE